MNYFFALFSCLPLLTNSGFLWSSKNENSVHTANVPDNYGVDVSFPIHHRLDASTNQVNLIM